MIPLGAEGRVLSKQEGIEPSLSTVYRILNKHLKLRKHSRTAGGTRVLQASKPRLVIQMDILDRGEVYAYTAIDIFTKEGQVVMRPTLQTPDGQASPGACDG